MSRRPASPSGSQGIPEATVARLPVYLRTLYALADRGIATVSSEDLAAAAGVNSAKLRKDLSHLGSYGTRGVGYDVEYLVYQVSRELGLTQDWPVVIVGAGNLGRALANYGGFASRGFRVAALLDSEPATVGTMIAGHEVRSADSIEQVVASQGISIGVIATPASAAQDVCDRLVAAGVTSILNFAPVVLNVPAGVDVRKVDLSIELQILAFHAQRRAVDQSAGQRGQRPRSALGRAGSPGGRDVSIARGRPQPQERPAHPAGARAGQRRRPGQAAARPVGRGARGGRVRDQHLQPGGDLRRGGQVPRRRVGHLRPARPALGDPARRAHPAPLRALRRPGRAAPARGGLRPRLDGGRREPDPRPGPAGAADRAGSSAPWTGRCPSWARWRCAPASARTPRPASTRPGRAWSRLAWPPPRAGSAAWTRRRAARAPHCSPG